MSEGWQIVSAGLGGLVVVTTAYLRITKLVLRNSLLELDRKHQEWCNGRFVSREVLEEKFDRLAKWTASMQGEIAHLRNDVGLLTQLKQAKAKE